MTKAFEIAGQPVTFATRLERTWKDAIQSALHLEPPPSPARGLKLQFTRASLTPNGKPMDVDNLCEPVFAVLFGRLGWFGGARPHMQWWVAHKRIGPREGCVVAAHSDAAPPVPEESPDLVAVYRGPMPTSALSPEVALWAQQWVDEAGCKQPDRLALRLVFGSTRVNIGEIPTGPVKSFIDCLFPLYGGVAGRPLDHRIDELIVQKGASDLLADEVRVSAWFKTV